MLAGSWTAFGLMATTVVIYNFIYTPLKKKTPFALLIGSVTGSMPPLIGYTALGGEINAPEIMVVCAVMYLWQTPHFAMLAEKYAEDYIKAGFRTLSAVYGKATTSVFIKIWVMTFLSSLFFVPLAGVYIYETSSNIHTVITVLTAFMLFLFYKNIHRVFHILNLSMVLFFLLLVIDRIII